jgi:hypothetical protein
MTTPHPIGEAADSTQQEATVMQTPLRTVLIHAAVRNARTAALVITVALLSSSTALAVNSMSLGVSNSASKTTTLKSGANAAVLQLRNTNKSGGSAAAGLGISVPAGRAPITVNGSAGKAINLNADRLDGFDADSFLRGPVEDWHEVGSAGNAAFWCLPAEAGGACPWDNLGYGYTTAAYYRDPLGTVHLKGTVVAVASVPASGCQATAIFTLPTGYRPSATTIAGVLHSDPADWGKIGLGRVDILTDGKVTICIPNGINLGGMWFQLDGISFRAG